MPGTLVLLLGSMMLASVPVGYLQVVLPLYLNRAGLEPSLIGLLYSLSGLVTAILVAFSGPLADRFGRRGFLIGGTALPMVSYAIFALTTDSAWLVVASLLGGVGLANGAAGALSAASFDALLAEHTPVRQRTRVFAWAQALWSLALGAGSVLAGLPLLLRQLQPGLAELDSYRPPFVLVIGLAALATLLLLPLGEPPPAPSPSPSGSLAHSSAAAITGVADAAPVIAPRAGWLPRRSMGIIVRYGLALGLFGLGLGIAVQLLPLWFKLRFNADEAVLGPWYAVAQVLSLGSILVAPWLERRIGSGMGVLAVNVLGAVCLILLVVLSPTFELAAALFVARTILANYGWPLQQAQLMTAVAPEERATAAGVGFSIWGLANAAGPALGGALLENGSLGLPLLLGAASYVLGGLAFGFGFRGQARIR